MNKINTNTHNDYNISDQYFQDDGNYKRASDMRVTRERIFQRQHLTIKKCLFPNVKIPVKDNISIYW